MEKVLYCFNKIILKSTPESKTSQPCLHTVLFSSKHSYRPMRARVAAQFFIIDHLSHIYCRSMAVIFCQAGVDKNLIHNAQVDLLTSMDQYIYIVLSKTATLCAQIIRQSIFTYGHPWAL